MDAHVEFCVESSPSVNLFGKVGTSGMEFDSTTASSCLLVSAVPELPGIEQPSLTLIQIKEMASLICQQKLRHDSLGDDDDTVPLSHLLEAFKQIGFTKNVLHSKLKCRQSSNNSPRLFEEPDSKPEDFAPSSLLDHCIFPNADS